MTTCTYPVLAQTEVSPEEAARRAERFPYGARLAFEDLEHAGREHALDTLRRHEPVSWVPALGGWLATSRTAARAVLGARGVSSVKADENLVRASLGHMMLTTDGDEHDRLRKPFERPFRPAEAERRFGRAAAELTATLIDAFADRGECNLGSEFAAPYAILMAGHVLGLDLSDVQRLDRIYSALAAGMVYDGDPARALRANAAREELNGILGAELIRKRENPDESLTSHISRVGDHGLGDDEVIAQLRVILFGAIETVQASVLTTMFQLLHHPDQLAQVRADPELVHLASEEARRLIPPVAFVERWTREPLQIDDVTIPAGEFVGVSVLAANRDPATFTDPLTYDIHRPNVRRSLAFSFGEHACLGLHLARVQTAIAVRALLERLPDAQIVSHDQPDGFAFRKPDNLRITWRI